MQDIFNIQEYLEQVKTYINGVCKGREPWEIILITLLTISACYLVNRIISNLLALATLKPQAGIVSAPMEPKSQYGVEADGVADQPVEEAGMTPEVIQKFQDKAILLTYEHKKHDKSVPEDLLKPEQIRQFQTLASHPQYGVADQPVEEAGMTPEVIQKQYGVADQPVEEAGMTSEVIQKLEDKAFLLTHERKKPDKSVPEDLLKPGQIHQFQTLASHPGLHSASVPGILSMDVCPTDTSKILTGGNDKNAAIFNKDTEQVITILKGHTKKVTSVIYHPEEDTVITASPDSMIRIWHVPTSQTIQAIKAHEGGVTGLSLHATGDYLLSTSTDEHWAFSDLRTGRVLTKEGDTTNPHSLTTAQFHPDGLIFGTGTSDSLIKIWDLKERANVANFPGHSGPISAIAFSENGYYLATSADDSVVKLWDLRKQKNFKTLTLDEAYEVKSLCFDQSGTYLAVAGSDIRIYLCTQWENLKTFTDHTALATGVRFGQHAHFVASVSMDRTLKIYGM
ncbi:unnamed protein product [Larinioides sclopetarius]|uniref:Pre-mRNA-processing factor 19 n=1 Tax=Larinioides sclopetarius TaxID=280406 RepID=A0AAV2A2C9_9ARAC